ncbi:MAG: 2,3-bisphosphoglycerate-independent phosphoglycerate mutase [Acidaminococcaceae bacterium]|nr:2,3-bisphosphoglycerate-independent phosphoglycerate mutase [Acidaminococcaceae bacterium]
MLETSGLHVGLPNGQMGNSEVGHTNLGAGRVVMQDLPRIDQAIENHTLDTNPVLCDCIQKLKKTGGTCHLMGLLGPGGVHAQQRHVVALAKLLDQAGIPTVIHGFLDGRDTPPNSAKGFVQELQDEIAPLTHVSIGTVGGRYYGMDRDNRWDRVTLAYEAIVNAKGNRFNSAVEAIESSYQQKVLDEFVVPCVIQNYAGMKDGDAVMMANYRSDRAREITRMMLQPDFDLAPRSRVIQFVDAVAMTEYSSDHTAWMHTLFPPEDLKHIFGEEVANAGMTQLRIAETEKYAHVTFFFNGGREAVFSGEDRILVASPKVATYDLKPEMSAVEVTDKLVEAIQAQKYDVIVVNYANGDMVGHTGSIPAAVHAVETVDACVGRVLDALKAVDGCAFITADRGNCEDMVDETGKPKTAHTNTPVQAVLFNAHGVKGLAPGKLADVAPTLLQLLGLKQPAEMSGKSLIKE